MGRKKAAMIEDKRALRVVKGKFLKERVVEEQLILGMREIGFSSPF